MIGLPRGTVKLSPYSDEWRLLYQNEKEELIQCIGEYIIDIQHVGSTSIPNLDSKPIIDIVIGIKKLNDGFLCIEPLKKLGYKYKGTMGESKRFFFAKGDEENRTHHVHIVEYGDRNWDNLTLFRDYLIKHLEVKNQYRALKKSLAQVYANDRDTYTSKKVDFILSVIKKAKIEKELFDKR